MVNSQSSAKASVSCSTIGPSSWKCVSSTMCGGLSARMFSAPMLMPPVKASRPSTTITLRWLRRFTNGMRHGKYECRNRATGTPARAQVIVGARPEIAAADAVDQHPHLDAAALRLDQRLVEGLARLVGAEDVAHQPDALLRRRDRRQHARIGLIAAVQQLDLVAGLAGQPGQPADREFQRRQRVGWGPPGPLLGDGERQAMASQPLGTPLDAVDAHDRRRAARPGTATARRCRSTTPRCRHCACREGRGRSRRWRWRRA